MSGGMENAVGSLGSVDYRLDVDTSKLGPWPGGFLNVHAMWSYGTSVNAQAGALVPVKGAAPVSRRRHRPTTTALMKLTVTQFLTPWLAFYIGKIDKLEADNNAFATIGEPSS